MIVRFLASGMVRGLWSTMCPATPLTKLARSNRFLSPLTPPNRYSHLLDKAQ